MNIRPLGPGLVVLALFALLGVLPPGAAAQVEEARVQIDGMV